MLRTYTLAALLLSAGWASSPAATTVPSISFSISPNTVQVGAATTLVASATFSAPGALQVNLLRLDSQGTATIVGPMHDDGQHGDGVPGDGTFTLNVSVLETVAGTVGFSVSAAFPGQLKRLQSSVSYVTVAGAPDMTPAGLAQRLLHPPDGQTSKAAILDLLKATSLGVYDSAGNTISRGAERDVTDFYTYDFEVDLLAAAMARGSATSLADLCTLLNNGPFSRNPITPAALLSSYSQAIAAAQSSSSDTAALVPLLIYELGKAGATPYDLLSSTLDPNTVTFDPVQALLLVCDFYMPTIMTGALPPSGFLPVANSVAPAALSTAFVRSADVSLDTCEQLEPLAAPIFEWGKYLLGKYGPEGGEWIPTTIESLHGLILGYSIQVIAGYSNPYTHYGHGPEPLHLFFPVQVNMLDKLPAAIVKCGWLAGVKFPDQGPVPNINMVWFDDDLKVHGSTTCPNSGCQQTNDSGLATLEFIPNQESQPGVGKQKEYTGLVEGVARYQSSLGNNLIGGTAQILFPKLGTFRWFVCRHEPGGWGGEVATSETGHTIETTSTPAGNGTHYTYDEKIVSGQQSYFSRDGQDFPDSPIGEVAYGIGNASAKASDTRTYIDITQYTYTLYGPTRSCSYLNRYTSTSSVNMEGSTGLIPGAAYSYGVFHYFPQDIANTGVQTIHSVIQDSCYPSGNLDQTYTRGTDGNYFPDAFLLTSSDPSNPFVGAMTQNGTLDGVPTVRTTTWSFADMPSQDPPPAASSVQPKSLTVKSQFTTGCFY